MVARNSRVLVAGVAVVVALAVCSPAVAHDDPQQVAPGPAVSNDPAATPPYGASPQDQTQAEPVGAPAAGPAPAPVAEPPRAAVHGGAEPAPAAVETRQSRPQRQPARAQAPRRAERPASDPLPATPARRAAPSRRGIERRASQATASMGAADEPRRSRTGASSPTANDGSGARTATAARFGRPLAPVVAAGERSSSTASAADQHAWLPLAFGALGVLALGAAGFVALRRRRRSVAGVREPSADELEVALQEMLAEERAREATRPFAGV